MRWANHRRMAAGSLKIRSKVGRITSRSSRVSLTSKTMIGRSVTGDLSFAGGLRASLITAARPHIVRTATPGDPVRGHDCPGGGTCRVPPPGRGIGGSAGAETAGACGGWGGGHLGERPVVADTVADDLRQAVGQDVQVVLAGADGFVERVGGRVVLDQRAAE